MIRGRGVGTSPPPSDHFWLARLKFAVQKHPNTVAAFPKLLSSFLVENDPQQTWININIDEQIWEMMNVQTQSSTREDVTQLKMIRWGGEVPLPPPLIIFVMIRRRGGGTSPPPLIISGWLVWNLRFENIQTRSQPSQNSFHHFWSKMMQNRHA